MKTKKQYAEYQKPSWAPPAWLFGPVWSVLYIIIAISFGYVGYLWFEGKVSFMVLLPFLLNLAFNFAFTPLQFTLRNFFLAMLDIFLVLGTLAWALVSIFPLVPWVAYANLPYLAWVSFATVLQVAVFALNTERR